MGLCRKPAFHFYLLAAAPGGHGKWFGSVQTLLMCIAYVQP